MSIPFKTIAATLTLATALASRVAAQQPHIQNGVIDQPTGGITICPGVSIDCELSRRKRRGSATPCRSVDGERVMCCFNSGTTFVDGTTTHCVRVLRIVPARELVWHIDVQSL